MEEQLAEEPLEEQLAEEPTEEPEFNGFSLRDFPVEAHPDMTKKHAGKFSYTVYLTAGGETGTIDVLLRKRGYYVKKPIGDGRRTTVSFSKFGGPVGAWARVQATFP